MIYLALKKKYRNHIVTQTNINDENIDYFLAHKYDTIRLIDSEGATELIYQRIRTYSCHGNLRHLHL